MIIEIVWPGIEVATPYPDFPICPGGPTIPGGPVSPVTIRFDWLVKKLILMLFLLIYLDLSSVAKLLLPTPLIIFANRVFFSKQNPLL